MNVKGKIEHNRAPQKKEQQHDNSNKRYFLFANI